MHINKIQIISNKISNTDSWFAERERKKEIKTAPKLPLANKHSHHKYMSGECEHYIN